MRAALKVVDDRLANVEAKISAVVLLVMIAAAFVQALLEVLAKRVGLDAAQGALESIGNIDHFLQTATLWLAFLGASLATHADKHIAIDVLDRLLSKKAQRIVKALTYLVSGLISLALTWIFVEVILKEGSIIPAEMAAFQDGDEVHLCDARGEVLADNDLSRPSLFCALRSVVSGVGVTLQAPRPAFQLIVPLLFLVISVRFLLRGVRYALGDVEPTEAPATTPKMPEPGEPAVAQANDPDQADETAQQSESKTGESGERQSHDGDGEAKP